MTLIDKLDTMYFAKVGSSTILHEGGADGITSAINSMTSQVYGIIKAIATGVAVVAFAIIFLQMIISSDAQTVARKKQQLFICAISLAAIQLADNLGSWIASIGTSALTA
jgi:hypothetical protein